MVIILDNFGPCFPLCWKENQGKVRSLNRQHTDNIERILYTEQYRYSHQPPPLLTCSVAGRIVVAPLSRKESLAH